MQALEQQPARALHIHERRTTQASDLGVGKASEPRWLGLARV